MLECLIARVNEIKDKDYLGTAAVKTMESQATSVAAAKSQSGTPSTLRLVIRVRISAEGLPRAPVRRRLSRGALLLFLGVVALLLTWVGIGLFRTDPIETVSVVSNGPLPKLATEAAQPKSTEAKSVGSEVREQPDAPTSPINEAIPDVPRSARNTIRGTVRVTVRVIVGKEGTVLGATADDPGPSRYFERLAVEASKKWTFTRADSAAQRIMRVTFNFTRAGTTARVNSLR